MVETQQKETIIWNKYPDVKPSRDRRDDRFLVSFGNGCSDQALWCGEEDEFWEDRGIEESERETEVFAWAEMPKGWQDG